jgi:MinD-like ATPase involved in chromosome partitioning or flagellar assembly
MTRYLPENGAARESGQGDPAGSPDVSDPSVTEPGADLDDAHSGHSRAHETTAVLAPDVNAAIRVHSPQLGPQPPRPGPRPPQPGPPPPLVAASPVRTAPRPEPSASPAETGEPTTGDPEGKTTPVDPATRDAATAARFTGVAPPADSGPRTGPQPAAPPSAGQASTRYGAPPRRPGTPPNAGPPARPQPAPPPRPSAPAWDTSAPIPASGPWNPGPAAAHLRPDELVKSRTLPPEMGWRKAVYVSTGHLLNLGAGPAERTLRDQIACIGSNIPGNYTIAVVSIKGGVGKTRTTAGLGTVYATHRTEPVLALDANPTYGSLGRIVDSRATASIREYLADEHVNTYPKARSYTGKNRQGLEVLAGNQNVANPLGLTDQLFNDALYGAQRFYQLTVVDCGNNIEHRVMRGVLGAADALVIVGTMNYDGAEAAEKTIDWLTVRNMADLLRRSALVLNDVNRCYNRDFFVKVRERLEPRVGGVTLIPYDKHLRDSAELDFDALRDRTQLAYLELAAWLAQGFAAPRAGLR